MKVAAIQMVSGPRLADNLRDAQALLAEAARAGAELAVLPEYFCLMGQRDTDKLALAEPLGEGPIQRWLADTARALGLWLVGGTLPLAPDGAPPPLTHTAGAGQPLLLGSPLLAAAATWRDFAWLRSQTSLPILVKGVMTAEDAGRALDEGADGVVVSNHGGRVLDGQPASLDVLPEIYDLVGDRAPVLFDGGVRNGGDVFKALALGARAVLIGRPYIWGLAAAGAVGVSHVIHMLRAELEATMALTGRRRLSEIDRTAVRC